MKPHRGNGELVLYTDFDGVLHHESVWRHPRRGPYLEAPARYTLFQHTALLEAALAPHPEVLIVLSTSWVLHYGFSRTAKKLPESLRERTVGATFHSQMRPNKDAFAATPRGLQILRDVERRQPRDWLALDDQLVGWPAECEGKVVFSDPYEGLSSPAVLDELSAKLAAMCGRGPNQQS